MGAEISRQEVAHVARLARLEIEDEVELARYAEQLSAVLEHVEAVRRLDMTSVPPTAHALEITNVFREDVVLPSLDREEVLAMAPDAESGRFRVPRILGEAP